jgi:glycosyltransferase involved in cell wall biosynthesis
MTGMDNVSRRMAPHFMTERSGKPRRRERWIALLGKRDEPTDALEDYCQLLAEALGEKGGSLELIRVRWAENGWRRSLRQLSRQLADRRGGWVLVQYTHLAWSRRGFPLGFPRMIRRLIRGGMSVLIVFHDPAPFSGDRLRDRLRRRVQLAVIRRAARLAHRIVTTVSLERVPWMRESSLRVKALSVPVGSNLPALLRCQTTSRQDVRGIVVFGFSNLEAEAALIASVTSRVAEEFGPLRLIVFGRGANLAEKILRRLLDGSRVELEAFGIVPPEQAGSLLANSDVQLFVRSGLSARRGSAIAGIACGLPIVGFADEETAFPITEAGVRLLPVGDVDGLVRELASVLREDALRETLRQRSLEATRRYFSWKRIADQYLSAIG